MSDTTTSYLAYSDDRSSGKVAYHYFVFILLKYNFCKKKSTYLKKIGALQTNTPDQCSDLDFSIWFFLTSDAEQFLLAEDIVKLHHKLLLRIPFVS